MRVPTSFKEGWNARKDPAFAEYRKHKEELDRESASFFIGLTLLYLLPVLSLIVMAQFERFAYLRPYISLISGVWFLVLLSQFVLMSLMWWCLIRPRVQRMIDRSKQ